MLDYRRRLPHISTAGTPVFVNWRLAGSIPVARCAELLTSGRAFLEEDRALERQASGPKWLSNAAVAACVAEAFDYGDKQRHFYELHAWVVMPNHVHVLLTPQVPLPQITRWLKGSTARQANLLLNRTGQPFWLNESWDRVVRDRHEFARITRYIEQNPVSAGLVHKAKDWLWSSAGRAGESAYPT